MTKTDTNKYKEILEARQAELAGVLRNRDAITIEKSPDALDEVQNAAERELAIRNLDRESNLLRNVRAALRRIDEVAVRIRYIAVKLKCVIGWCVRCKSLRSRTSTGLKRDGVFSGRQHRHGAGRSIRALLECAVEICKCAIVDLNRVRRRGQREGAGEQAAVELGDQRAEHAELGAVGEEGADEAGDRARRRAQLGEAAGALHLERDEVRVVR